MKVAMTRILDKKGNFLPCPDRPNDENGKRTHSYKKRRPSRTSIRFLSEYHCVYAMTEQGYEDEALEELGYPLQTYVCVGRTAVVTYRSR